MSIQREKRRPLIGVLPAHIDDHRAVSVPDRYCDAIIACGGSPVVLPLTEQIEVYAHLFSLLDGFLLTGGHDIDPARYGVSDRSENLTMPEPNREEAEFTVLSYAHSFDMPVLGICRGMQMINVFYGGSLYLDLPHDYQNLSQPALTHWQNPPYADYSHKVKVSRPSQLYDILGKSEASVNSMHHQGVKSVGAKVAVSARATDGIPEAIEVKNRAFILGVQWHPEFLLHDASMKRLFESLIGQAYLGRITGRGARAGLSIKSQTGDGPWPSISFDDYV